MRTWVQRLRGAVGIGITWAIGWTPLGAITGWITGTLLGFAVGDITANYALMFGVLGFVGGAIFSTVLSLAERGRSFGSLSLPRFVAWGALGGLLLGGLAVAGGLLGARFTMIGATIIGASTLLGAASAAATLIAARSANRQALPSGDLAGEDGRQLLGSAE